MGDVVEMPERLDAELVVDAIRAAMLEALHLLMVMDPPEGRRRICGRCPTTAEAMAACGWTGLAVDRGRDGARVLQEFQYGDARWVPWRFAVLDDSPGEAILWWWGEFKAKAAAKPALTDRPEAGA